MKNKEKEKQAQLLFSMLNAPDFEEKLRKELIERFRAELLKNDEGY